MSVPFDAVVAPLARSREALDALFGHIIILAHRGPLPCGFVEAYTALRARQLRAEMLTVQAAKAAGLHPPEDAPRSLAVIGACSPGNPTVTLSPAAIKAGREYLTDVAKRRRFVDQMLAKSYQENEAFRKIADAELLRLASAAQANTAEALPPPRNIGLLKLLYFIGGTPWGVTDVEAFRQGGNVDQLEGAEVVKLFQDVIATTAAVQAAIEAAPAPKKKKRGLPWWGWGLSLLGTAAASYAAWRLARSRRTALADIVEDDVVLPPRRRVRRGLRSRFDD